MKLTVRELREKLFNTQYFLLCEKEAIDQILEAYSDLHDQLEFNQNLKFFCKNSVCGQLAIKIADRCIDTYNEFDKEIMEKVVKVFGDESSYYFAREYSVCVYVKPYQNIYLDRVFSNLFNCDEFSYDHKLGMFRIWWD
jgi:hypothetical protein